MSDTIETWSTLSADDVFPAGAAERINIATVKGVDDLQDICGEVTQQVRQAYILGNRDVGPDGTIPDGLMSRAVAIALWRFVSEGVPKNEGIQTKERKDAWREALDYLDKISSLEIGKTVTPSIDERHRRFKHRDEDGI